MYLRVRFGHGGGSWTWVLLRGRIALARGQFPKLRLFSSLAMEEKVVASFNGFVRAVVEARLASSTVLVLSKCIM